MANRIARAVVAALLSTPALAQTSPETLFTNVRVFDGSGAPLTAPTAVLVRGNTIAAIGASATSKTATVIDGHGRTLMPGLIDNHVHITMGASSQADLVDPRVTPEMLQARGQAEAEAMLLRGFTAVRDMGGPIFAIKATIDSGKSVGPRIWPSGAMVSQTSGHGDGRLPNERSRRWGGEVSRGELLGAYYIADGRAEVLTAVREDLRAGASQIKVMAGGGAASAYDPLDVAQYTFDELRAAVEAADDWNTYVTVHAYTPKAVRRAVDAGVKCIEHGQLLDEATVELLAEKGIWLSLQVLDPAPPTAPESTRAKKLQVVDGTDAAYRWAKQYHVKLAWGTDFLFNVKQNVNQGKDITKLAKWFTPPEILKMVTHDNAELLAMSGPRTPYAGKLGVVETGALADLILVDGDPTHDINLVADPAKTFVVIMKDGKIYKNITTGGVNSAR
ncbi:metal-dependent hydrolase family protein [Polymorphobacter arshaanensis]|nr:amidohydrolase family protein [Polymorphobacter arshaanensis]